MPRYFFHIHDGTDALDPEGIELDSAEQARREALVAAGSILREQLDFRWDEPSWALHVVDEDNRTVCRLTLAASLD